MAHSTVKMLVLTVFIALLSVIFWPAPGGVPCNKTPDQDVTSFVGMNFLDLLTRWDNEAQRLGTKTPEITFLNIDRTTINPVSVLFKAEGPGGSRQYFGMYECEKRNVEYATR